MTPEPTFLNPSFAGQIGIAQEEINPPEGIYARNWGAAKNDIAGGMHRPLTLTCFTFQSAGNEQPLILIGADLGWWKNSEYELQLRNRLLTALSLDSSQLMFCLSHTHAGPGICPDDAAQPGGDLIEGYLQSVGETTLKTIRKALENAVPAILSCDYGKCNMAVNRDLPDPHGDRILTGFNPEGFADDTLLVGRITEIASNNIIGVMVNYACHPTTLAWENELISPDYIGAMRELVEAVTDAPCLFIQGASGDLSAREQFSGDTGLADRYGRQLGFSVLSTLEGMLSPGHLLAYAGVIESGASLGMWKELPFQPSSQVNTLKEILEFELKDFPELDEIEADLETCQDRVLKERLWRKRCIRKAIGNEDTAKVPVWIWKLGDLMIVGQPNEPYADFQIELRKAFPQYAVAVGNLVNGSIGYLPPSWLYEKNAYPVWQTPFAAGGLDHLTMKTVQLIKKLT